MRPVLKSALRPLWRDPATMQLGLDPRHAVVLTGLDAGAASVIGLLDGTRDWAGVLDRAVELGAAREAATDLLSTLHQAGVLDDAAADPSGLGGQELERLLPDLASLSLLCRDPGAGLDVIATRRQACVLVVGAGRVGAAAASLLAAAGVGTLRLHDSQHASPRDAVPGGVPAVPDAGPRVVQVAAEVARAGAAAVAAAVHHPDEEALRAADLAVLALDGHQRVDPVLHALLRRAGTSYLVTAVRETVGVVGPLVRPGWTSCAHCHDLARSDRDPAWPGLAAQLAAPARSVAACDVVLASAVAAVAAGQVLATLAGPGPELCVDATLELRLPEWSLRRRVWAAHPDCPCGAGRT